MNLRKAFIGFACAAVAATALAEVIVDSEGYGFVGKGDVQLAFGWNNAQLQQNGMGVSFYVKQEGLLGTYVCEWTTNEKKNAKTHDVTKKVHGDLVSSINFEARKNKQQDITGFNLIGFGSIDEEEGKALPSVGDSCIGEGTGAKVVEVTPADGELVSGGLYVKYGDLSVKLQ